VTAATRGSRESSGISEKDILIRPFLAPKAPVVYEGLIRQRCAD
jgi:hypothetical protein